SLRNFEAGEIGVLNVAGKPLPFRSELANINVRRKAKELGVNRYTLIKNVLLKAQAKSIAIDDTQFLLAFDSFDNANVKGYDKWTMFAVDFEQLITFVIDELPEDKIVYFLHHTEQTDTGTIKAKTIGKMLDNQLTVEGLFTIVLLCMATKDEHKFITQSGGTSTAKSPEDMLPEEMPNDLKAVDTAIREYWGLNNESG
ncbi:MAG: hypothetical protein UHG68_09680, partial [Clostridia bacterium]|nr:hypothetical protein [Clostridia bacterium]